MNAANGTLAHRIFPQAPFFSDILELKGFSRGMV